MTNDKIEGLKELYLKAKKAYYTGNTIMSDEEFDALEEVLKSLNLDVTQIVGIPSKPKITPLFDLPNVKETKGKHVSKLLSLEKIKTGSDGLPPTEDALFWFTKSKVNSVVVELKYDGNAVNLIYKNGKFTKALTRGDGIEGMDITNKVKYMIPGNIPETISLNAPTVEIRGEVIIAVPVFEKKYNQFKNPRNFIAGVLHRDDTDPSVLQDLSFIPFDVRTYDPDMQYEDIDILENTGFELPYTLQIDSTVKDFANKFNNVYDKLSEYRKNSCKYQLDGFVMKTKSIHRKNLGEGSHHPNWALAVKFQNKTSITKINDIEWSIGKNGNLYPVALLEPIDLDGSTISRCSLYNYGWIIDNKCYPGAVIEIARKGDIIPGITKIIKESDIYY